MRARRGGGAGGRERESGPAGGGLGGGRRDEGLVGEGQGREALDDGGADPERVADGGLDAGSWGVVPVHAQHGSTGVEGVARRGHGAPDVTDDARTLDVAEGRRLPRADAQEVGVAASPVPARGA